MNWEFRAHSVFFIPYSILDSRYEILDSSLELRGYNSNFYFSLFQRVIFYRAKNYLRFWVNIFSYNSSGFLDFVQRYVVARSIKQNTLRTFDRKIQQGGINGFGRRIGGAAPPPGGPTIG